MARLIGYIANRADRLRDAFHQERQAIVGLPADQRGAWGVGFYQGDEVLHRKQPTPSGEPVDWSSILDGMRTDCVLAHVRQATVGGFSVDNTHPFRLRQWLFAHIGTISAFDEVRETLRAELPDFLRRNLRGNSDSELVFHWVLAALHERNQLDAASPSEDAVLESIAQATSKIDAVTGTEHQPSTLNLILSNGRAVFALRHGGPFGYVERTGLTETVSGEEHEERPGSPLLRYVMLVAGGPTVPEGYEEIADRHLAVVNRDDLEVHLKPM